MTSCWLGTLVEPYLLTRNRAEDFDNMLFRSIDLLIAVASVVKTGKDVSFCHVCTSFRTMILLARYENKG